MYSGATVRHSAEIVKKERLARRSGWPEGAAGQKERLARRSGWPEGAAGQKERLATAGARPEGVKARRREVVKAEGGRLQGPKAFGPSSLGPSSLPALGLPAFQPWAFQPSSLGPSSLPAFKPSSLPRGVPLACYRGRRRRLPDATMSQLLGGGRARILRQVRPTADPSTGPVGAPLRARTGGRDREPRFEVQDPAQPARAAHPRLLDSGVPGRPAPASSQSDQAVFGLRGDLLPVGPSGRLQARLDGR